jgi:hypothetical protein
VVLAAAITVLLLLPMSAAAADTAVSMKFNENTGPGAAQGCPVAPDGTCGSGQVVPFGRATETILEVCNGTCAVVRTITLASGTIVLEEGFVAFDCPGACESHGRGFPRTITVSDTVIGGTGGLAGATGTLTGTIKGAGSESQVELRDDRSPVA